MVAFGFSGLTLKHPGSHSPAPASKIAVAPFRAPQGFEASSETGSRECGPPKSGVFEPVSEFDVFEAKGKADVGLIRTVSLFTLRLRYRFD